MPIIPIITETSTNTLATITDGTNIYQQQEITITHISYTINKTNITNTDWITNTINSIPQLDKIETILSQDPTSWETFFTVIGPLATVVSAAAMIVTAYIMYQGNKISTQSSTDSIHEMREQYKQQKKDIQDREDKKELREYIEKYIIPEVEKFKAYDIRAENKEHVQHAISFNSNSFDYLARLIAYSLGSFYRESLQEIFDKIYIFYPIIHSSEEYTDNVKIDIYALLLIISANLYKALIDEQAFEKLMNQIDRQTKNIERSLKPNEIKKIRLRNV